jgi:hypothetical protein
MNTPVIPKYIVVPPNNLRDRASSFQERIVSAFKGYHATSAGIANQLDANRRVMVEIDKELDCLNVTKAGSLSSAIGGRPSRKLIERP